MTPVTRVRFQSRDWLLITAIENRTREEIFDGSIEYALENELANSRYVGIVSRERVDDTLRMMAKPASTVLTAGLRRELALRDGGIRTVLGGRFEKLDTRYVLRLQLVDPTNGDILASASEEARTHGEVLGAINRQADWIRRALGESLPANVGSRQTTRARDDALASGTPPVFRSGREFLVAPTVGPG